MFYPYLEGGLPDEDSVEKVIELQVAEAPPDLLGASCGNEDGVGGAVQVHHCLELLSLTD